MDDCAVHFKVYIAISYKNFQKAICCINIHLTVNPFGFITDCHMQIIVND